ncbi:hypothetical protein F4861DRAFT_539657 [Xylaria intraflava]|nr:hypothetical protein F4861DRAFT_539657 [Xylaria intraflava]
MEWLGEFVYVALISIIRSSVLFTYWRVFPTRLVKRGAIVLGTIAGLWFVSATFIIVFQCSPIQKSWDQAVMGTCICTEGCFLGLSIPNIITNFAIICLPVYEVTKLNMNKGTKLGLIVVFWLGGLAVIAVITKIKVFTGITWRGLAADFRHM